MAVFRTSSLEDLAAGELGAFDTVFAVNVNLFWTRPAQHEIGLVLGMLAPTGTLHLMYTPPAGSDVARLDNVLAPRLESAGLRHKITAPDAGADQLVTFTVPLPNGYSGRR